VTPFRRVNADPLFAPHVDYPTAAFPSSAAIGDFNGDTKPDLVTANLPHPTYPVSVLLGNGDGTLAPNGIGRPRMVPASLLGSSSTSFGPAALNC
jgi:hypothetical protein